jgi:hypothetical protein
MSASKTITFVIFIVLSCALLDRTAHAQAWVGFEGNSLTLGTDYTYAPSDRVVETEGLSVDADISNHSMALSAEYTVIPRLAFNVSVPVLASIYTPPADGVDPFGAHGRYDDGDYHVVLHDLRVMGRYMVLFQPVAITPHVGFSMPMTNYETVGYAGAGRGLKQLHLGLNVGKFFTSGPVSNFYVHGTYEFSLVERYETPFPETAEYGQNKSDVKGLLGYFITDNIEVNLGLDWRIPHGGIDFVDFNELPKVVRDYHDGLLREGFLIMGLGSSYQITERLRVFGMTRFWITGTNTRDINIFGAGVTYDVL